MKNVFLILIFILLSIPCIYSQELERKNKFSPEIMFSVNRTTVMDRDAHGRFGFGTGVHYALFDQKRCNLIVGFEYNRNSLFVKYINTNGKWGGGNYNTTYHINNIGIPVSVRVNMGKKVIFFVETGTFFDFAIFGKEKGLYKRDLYNPADSTITIVEKPFNDKASYEMPNFGIQGGIGLRIPIQKYEILLKGDYKWGVRNLIDNYNFYGILHNRYWRFSVGFKANF